MRFLTWFFFFFFFFLSGRRVRFESVTALKYGTWFWMNKIQDRTQSWRSLLFKCFNVSAYLFLYILTSKFIKNWKKIASKTKFKPWILLNQTCTEKQMCAAALRPRMHFFSLTCILVLKCHGLIARGMLECMLEGVGTYVVEIVQKRDCALSWFFRKPQSISTPKASPWAFSYVVQQGF